MKRKKTFRGLANGSQLSFWHLTCISIGCRAFVLNEKLRLDRKKVQNYHRDKKWMFIFLIQYINYWLFNVINIKIIGNNNEENFSSIIYKLNFISFHVFRLALVLIIDDCWLFLSYVCALLILVCISVNLCFYCFTKSMEERS